MSIKYNGIHIVSRLSAAMIKAIEQQYNAKYVCDLALKASNGNWTYSPGSIFYTKEKHPQGSNYFAMFNKSTEDGLFICDALPSILACPIQGIVDHSGTVIYSRSEHDFVQGNGVAIDGGRYYTRVVGDISCPRVILEIVEDKLVVV